MKLTEKEAWLIIAESYCGAVSINGVPMDTSAWWNNGGYGIPGICWRVDSLRWDNYISQETFSNMMKKVKNDLGRKIYFSRKKDLKARSIYCILQAAQS